MKSNERVDKKDIGRIRRFKKRWKGFSLHSEFLQTRQCTFLWCLTKLVFFFSFEHTTDGDKWVVSPGSFFFVKECMMKYRSTWFMEFRKRGFRVIWVDPMISRWVFFPALSSLVSPDTLQKFNYQTTELMKVHYPYDLKCWLDRTNFFYNQKYTLAVLQPLHCTKAPCFITKTKLLVDLDFSS